MKTMFKNWRTTLIGGGALTAGITEFVETGDWRKALPLLLLGLLGLLTSDANGKPKIDTEEKK